eukprot:TRINITY_DN4405_c0_g1_i3.p1 TRINITY_DN4405_c0_g1~~TRINITY_DN4405_c0_g1_i3.p1  ORF type:complete len:192 (-),score=56.73 TRINITY_DN4405_c0_g1_i3:408-983(-)
MNLKMRVPLLLFSVLFLSIYLIEGKKGTTDKPDWAKKDIRDFSDADMERLLDQWEEDEEPLPLDELPEGDPRRPQPKIDISNAGNDPEGILKASKKGKSLMVFVRVNGSPSKAETQDLMSLWQTALWNNHIQVEVFPLEEDRSILMFKDGSVAWDAKDFLVEEPRVQDVTIEQKTYYGKHTKEYAQNKSEL